MNEEATPKAKPSRLVKIRKLLFLFGLILIVGVCAVAVKIALEGGDGLAALAGFGATEEVKPPPTAAEIIAAEFAGEIETAKVNPEDLTEPPPGALPLADYEPRDFDEPDKDENGTNAEGGANGSKKEDKKAGKGKKDADESSGDVAGKLDRSGGKAEKGEEKAKPRKTASLEAHALTVEKGKITVSKNLDKKKVLNLVLEKLDRSCKPKIPDDLTSLKAEMKITKSGTIANIKVTPASAEKELAKCMRQKLGAAKALKPKNKAVAKVTIQFQR